METRDVLYIGGEWVAPASTRTFTVVNPATQEVVATVPEGTEVPVRPVDSRQWMRWMSSGPGGAGSSCMRAITVRLAPSPYAAKSS